MRACRADTPTPVAIRQIRSGRKARGDRAGDLVLQVEQVFDFDVEAIGPEHAFGRGFDQLDRDAQALVSPAQAAAENVTHAQSSLDFLRGRSLEIK